MKKVKEFSIGGSGDKRYLICNIIKKTETTSYFSRYEGDIYEYGMVWEAKRKGKKIRHFVEYAKNKGHLGLLLSR